MVTLAAMPKYESYIDSGFKWIGQVPSYWEVTKLGACLISVSIKNRADLPLLSITRELGVIERDTDDQNSNHNFIPDDLSGYKVLKQGQFGMNKMKAWQGSYGVSAFTGIVSPAYFIFNFTKPIEPRFFNWAIRSKLYVSYFGSASDGVRIGQWDLSKDRMKAIPFILPSPKEQTFIANFLDQKNAQIDEAISIKEKQIALLKESKQIIIQKAVTQGLESDVPMKDSRFQWIGLVPEAWEVTKLGACLSPVSIKNRPDFTLLSITREKGVIERDVEDQESNHNFIPNDLSGYKLIEKGQFGMNKMKAWQGSYGVSKYTGIVSPAYFVFIFTKAIEPRFFNWAIRSKLYVSYFGSASDGVRIGQWDLSKSRMKVIPFILPSTEEQSSIANFLEKKTVEFDNAITFQQKQIEKLKEYKTTLINSAVTGKIKVA